MQENFISDILHSVHDLQMIRGRVRFHSLDGNNRIGHSFHFQRRMSAKEQSARASSVALLHHSQRVDSLTKGVVVNDYESTQP